MMTKKWILLVVLLPIVSVLYGQKRFAEAIFQQVDSVRNISYGSALNIKGEQEELLLDVIKPPATDTMRYRPLVIFIHGGGFQSNTKTGPYNSRLCVQFARQGYITATIDYRLGVEKPKDIQQYHEAMYRAQQDGKAAVRFFRKYAEQYGVDTSQIFITGSSAGSMTCLAMAYMDEAEIPSTIDRSKWGSLEGNSGNPGFSSKVQGVMNGWGALIDYKWIQPGDVPLFNVSGTADKTVPYDSSYDWHSFKYGSYILYQRCLSLGIPTGWRPFYETGHTLNSNPLKQDSAIASMSAWLYTQLRNSDVGNSAGVRRWEKDISRFDSLNIAERNKPGSILFLGSSYVRLWKNIRTDLKYPNIISACLSNGRMNPG